MSRTPGGKRGSVVLRQGVLGVDDLGQEGVELAFQHQVALSPAFAALPQGAVHADLDTALSDQGVVDPDGTHHPHPDAASGGRHPLPSREKFATWLSGVGFANDMQAVVYDRNGANYSGRLWWMLKWAGHEAVAVLDGGLQAWQAAGGEVRAGTEPSHFQTNFALGTPLRRLRTRPWLSLEPTPGARRASRRSTTTRSGQYRFKNVADAAKDYRDQLCLPDTPEIRKRAALDGIVPDYATALAMASAALALAVAL